MVSAIRIQEIIHRVRRYKSTEGGAHIPGPIVIQVKTITVVVLLAVKAKPTGGACQL